MKSPIIVIPGIQGHWQWMTPAIDALAQDRTVRAFSLNVCKDATDPFEAWAAEIDRQIAATGHKAASLVGVSFGGLVAMYYAATRPHRVTALVLVSAPSPRQTLTHDESQLLAHPISLLPLFAIRGLRRLLPEVFAALPTWRARVTFLTTYGWRVLRWPLAPAQTARWVRNWQGRDLASLCTKVTAPTHVMTGEPTLDRVVPVTSTLDYVTLIPGATTSRLERTGHIGLVSRPERFAALVGRFLDDLGDTRTRRTA
jgi:pimeloyl-ACP methyl ester carboxylesterase